MSCFIDIENKPDDWLVLDPLTVQKPIPKTGCDTNLIVQNYLSEFKTDAQKQKVKDNLGLFVDNILSKNSNNPISNKVVYDEFNKLKSQVRLNTIDWSDDSDINDYVKEGIYNIKGKKTRQDDNLPIINTGDINARLTVIATESDNNIVITQVLNLNNNVGGEGNVYIRSCQNGQWKVWGKLQTNVEVGVVNQEQLDALVDNGIYSGILSTTGETFVIICINNYAIAQQVGIQHISHLKYSLVAVTGEVKIEKRTRDAYGFWTEWETIKGSENQDSTIKITWNSSSNMNDFKTAGVYDIYGERTRQDDNIPISNASSGHSIAARLTVVASTLQPANNEICVTQFLMLSNRLGGDGNMYVRTYNENNSPAADGWAPWQKLQGIREGYIFTDATQVNSDNQIQTIEGVTGLNNMIDNGLYSGVYTDDNYFDGRPTFIETFTLIVINNYAIAGQVGTNRTISQLKYAIDALTNQTSIKQRTKTDGGDWSDWADIGGGGSQEVDVTSLVQDHTLTQILASGLLKTNTSYKFDYHKSKIDIPKISNKLNNFDISHEFTAKLTILNFIENQEVLFKLECAHSVSQISFNGHWYIDDSSPSNYTYYSETTLL